MTQRGVVAVAAVIVGTVAAMAALDSGPNVPIVVAVTGLVLVVASLLRYLADRTAPPLPATERPDLPGAPPDLRITSLRQALVSGGSDHRLSRRVQLQLVAATDDELLASHRIDRATEPDAARRVLHPELAAFVEDPEAARTLSVRQLERIVTHIEELGAPPT